MSLLYIALNLFWILKHKNRWENYFKKCNVFKIFYSGSFECLGSNSGAHWLAGFPPIDTCWLLSVPCSSQYSSCLCWPWNGQVSSKAWCTRNQRESWVKKRISARECWAASLIVPSQLSFSSLLIFLPLLLGRISHKSPKGQDWCNYGYL